MACAGGIPLGDWPDHMPSPMDAVRLSAHYAVRVGIEGDDIDDAVQHAITWALPYLHQSKGTDGNGAPHRAWFCKCLRWGILDWHKRRAKEARVLLLDPIESMPDMPVDSRPEAIVSLSRAVADPIVAAYVDAGSIAAAADLLGISRRRVRAAIAKHRLE